IRLPALRERREDIPALVRFFLQRQAKELGLAEPSFTVDAIPFLVQQEDWPGNVRELQNVVCRALLLARGHPVSPEILQAALGRTDTPSPPKTQAITDYVADMLARAERGELENAEAAIQWDIEHE